MFDTHVTKTNLVTREVEKTVIVKNAPTDESVKLLNEYQDKALKNILDRTTVNDNKMNYTWVIHNNPLTLQMTFHYRTKMNGKEFTGDVEIQSYESPVILLETMMKDISDSIAHQMIKEYLPKYAEGKASRGKKY